MFGLSAISVRSSQGSHIMEIIVLSVAVLLVSGRLAIAAPVICTTPGSNSSSPSNPSNPSNQ
ncbi:MAG: hypothetical protein ISN29_05425 [Gammaproteobacteria bacterium AqS3]|nr:hypothetical protein [Gammaproteobacteria bacterium AqS3]